MIRYIVRRVLWGVALLFIVSAVVFVIFYLLPTADPAKLRVGRNPNPELIAQIREQLHLNDPVYVQFWEYMKGVFLHFDFGQSYVSQAPVDEIILDRLPATALLVAGAVVLWLAIGLSVGIISAIRRHSLMERSMMVASLALISAPVFWLGLVALYLFAEDVGVIHIFPGQGSYITAESFAMKCWTMVLPWTVLAAATAAVYARYMRSSMIDTMAEDYIRTARAKGLPERQVVLKHGVRSAITPIVTLLGLDIGLLLAGNAILTESVFNIPGIGHQIVLSIRRSDLPMIQGIVLFGAFFIIVFNLIVDILYAYLDPRVRYQ